MSSLSVTASATASGRPLLGLAALVTAIVVAGCGTGGLPSPSPAASTAVATPSGTTPSAGATPSATAPATTTPATTTPATVDPGATPAEPSLPGPSALEGPPAALLAGTSGAPAEGELGSYVWAGAGSDSPWIVPPPVRAVRTAGPYAVTFRPQLRVGGWKAAWAPVDGGAAGDPAGAREGDGGTILVDGPGLPGTWSLKVDVRFAAGSHASWYWRLVVAP